MWSYSTLPTIGIGCGMVTDHFIRSGVIGNGASPMWGMPASLATLETAMVAGVFDEPMMTSAFCSTTTRRALVVAGVGSPASSSTISFSGTPAISFGTNSSALRSGMPSAAAGPVVVMVMPMVISLVCAEAGEPGSANAAASAAADKKALFIHSSLNVFIECRSNFSPLFNPFFRRWLPRHGSAVQELLDDLGRHRCRFQLVRIIRVAADQDALLE